MPTTYSYPVIRWPFDIASGANAIRFEDTFVGSSVQSITPGLYLNRGAAGSPTDLITAFRAAANAAISALGLGGTWSFELEPDGRLSLQRLSGALSLVVNWSHADTTFPIELLGFDGAIKTTVNGNLKYSNFQVDGQWHSGRDPVFPGVEVLVTSCYEDTGLDGNPRLLNHTSSDFYHKAIEWDVIKAARMITARAADSLYADVAGIETGELNTWETLRDYLRGEPSSLGRNYVYHFDSNDPATATESGPYLYVLSKSTPGLRGVELLSHDTGRAVEEYPVKIVLWRSAS